MECERRERRGRRRERRRGRRRGRKGSVQLRKLNSQLSKLNRIDPTDSSHPTNIHHKRKAATTTHEYDTTTRNMETRGGKGHDHQWTMYEKQCGKDNR
jgi:hypothetical protein